MGQASRVTRDSHSNVLWWRPIPAKYSETKPEATVLSYSLVLATRKTFSLQTLDTAPVISITLLYYDETWLGVH